LFNFYIDIKKSWTLFDWSTFIETVLANQLITFALHPKCAAQLHKLTLLLPVVLEPCAN